MVDEVLGDPAAPELRKDIHAAKLADIVSEVGHPPSAARSPSMRTTATKSAAVDGRKSTSAYRSFAQASSACSSFRTCSDIGFPPSEDVLILKARKSRRPALTFKNGRKRTLTRGP